MSMIEKINDAIQFPRLRNSYSLGATDQPYVYFNFCGPVKNGAFNNNIFGIYVNKVYLVLEGTYDITPSRVWFLCAGTRYNARNSNYDNLLGGNVSGVSFVAANEFILGGKELIDGVPAGLKLKTNSSVIFDSYLNYGTKGWVHLSNGEGRVTSGAAQSICVLEDFILYNGQGVFLRLYTDMGNAVEFNYVIDYTIIPNELRMR